MQLLSTMVASQSAADLLGAVEVIDAAFHRRQIVTVADWDESLPNLIGAHDRCGGVVRSGIRALFSASYESGDSVRSAGRATPSGHHCFSAQAQRSRCPCRLRIVVDLRADNGPARTRTRLRALSITERMVVSNLPVPELAPGGYAPCRYALLRAGVGRSTLSHRDATTAVVLAVTAYDVRTRRGLPAALRLDA